MKFKNTVNICREKEMDAKLATRCKMFWNQHPATKAKVDDPADVFHTLTF